MSSHPNAMLICIFTPDDLAHRTYRAILSEAGIIGDEDLTLINEHFGGSYSHQIMEYDYD